MTKTQDSWIVRLSQMDLWLVLGVFGTVLLLILPVPPLLLDLLLAVSIASSLLILLVILYTDDPSEFTGFPSLLLFVTLFRLALNVATTRLILISGDAGHIIEAFGNFVVGGNYVVGIVIFSILVVINFVVITKGAGRIAEVAARFTLDAMPGKQMAIDAELGAGIINEQQARARRRKVEQEADFYGAMDGASKFVRGDAVAAVMITVVNIVGGFAIGMAQRGMSFTEALSRYTLLSIGDGLVSQIPALVTSMAAGLLVTRAASKNNFGEELGRQLTSYPRALTILSVMLAFLSVVPGLPMFPFLVLSVVTWFVGKNIKNRPAAGADAKQKADGKSGKSSEAAANAVPGSAAAPVGDKLENLLGVDALLIELGFGLVSLADSRKGGDLLERVTGVRRQFAQEMGLLIPPIKLRDNLQIGANEYRFLLKGNSVASGSLMPGYSLAMNATNSRVTLKGVPTTEPVFQLPATWITEVERKTAEIAGYTVVDASSVLITHLTEVVKHQSHEILSRQDVQQLLDHLKTTHPTVVNELIPAQLNVGQVQRILQNLLAEGISIRNLASILEKVSDFAGVTKNPDELSEHARRALGPQIVKPYQDDRGVLKAITLDPRLEQEIAKGVRQSQTEIALLLDPRLARHLVENLSKMIQSLLASGQAPVVLCGPHIRLAFRRFFEATFSDLTVLSYSEVPSRVDIQSAGTLVVPE
ncbi:MAG: flagellar biosynthesis protein FlhA [Verrucomicrobiota bacterium]|nr:flagellar biosynthesis protein FlhA [Verrucomicrobiota bacterium]